MAVLRDPKVSVAPAYKRDRRQLRNPQHPYTLRIRPYQIQPFAIAAVLPGETMESALIQDRALTDPLVVSTKLQGWWFEHWLFYVKHRDLGDPATYLTPDTISHVMTNFVLDPDNVDLDIIRDADGNAWTYCFPNGVDWLLQCTQRIVEEYFRDPGENWNSFTLDGVPMSRIRGYRQSDWAERLTLASQKRTDESGFVLNPTGDDLHPREMMDRWAHWQTLRENGLMDMDYNDYIKTYGSATREDETSVNLHRPELIKHCRTWQFPTNVVGSAGVASTQVSWETRERCDKAFRFNEPGFIVGLCCARPKVYFGNQQGSISGLLDHYLQWLPAVLQDNYEASYKLVDDLAGPLAAIMTEDYWLDIRDLYLHGEQFTNFNTTFADSVGVVDLPAVDANRRYASSTDIERFFVTPATVNKITVDGVLDLSIKGHQRKTVDGVVI